MNGRQLELNDGTIIPDGEAGLSQGFLWLWFTGYTLQQAAEVFFDPAKTSRITFDYGEMHDIYDGYTTCINLGISDGRCAVCMTRGANNA